MTMVFSSRVERFGRIAGYREVFCPSSVRRKEAARCGETPGVIFASNELSSARGGRVGSGTGRLSSAFGSDVDSFVSLPGPRSGCGLSLRFCSPILVLEGTAFVRFRREEEAQVMVRAAVSG